MVHPKHIKPAGQETTTGSFGAHTPGVLLKGWVQVPQHIKTVIPFELTSNLRGGQRCPQHPAADPEE